MVSAAKTVRVETEGLSGFVVSHPFCEERKMDGARSI